MCNDSVSIAKTYPSILNNVILVGISIAHQSVDISKFSACHFHYTISYVCEKLLNEKDIGLELTFQV